MSVSDPHPPTAARILHLEDDAKDHKLVRAALALDGIEHGIERVDSADAFRAKLTEHCYELILSDYSLPGFDGSAALAIARELCRDVPFIVVSGAMGDVAVADILRAGATDFVLKEHLDRLGPAIRRALREAAERSARRDAEAAVREARDAAESANRAKDRFLAMLSHELRTPLSPVVMALTAMQADPDLPPKFAGELSMVRRNIDLEVALIDDLLDLSRVMTGKLRLREAPTHLHTLITHVVASTAAATGDKRITLTTDLAAPGDVVLGDATRLQQVIWNLLNNAIKFTPAGGRISVCTTGEPAAAVGPDGGGGATGAVRVVISDSGCGVDAGSLSRLFRPFEQVNPELTREFGGLGLGLAIVKAVTEMHRGRAWATSDGLGRGAAFHVELPTVVAPADAVPAGPVAAPPGGPSKVRVLLVEDHDDTRRILTRLLTAGGFDVAAADSVAAAVAAAADRLFDVVVSDIGLPDGNGYALMEKLRGDYGFRGIALSGYGMEDDVARGRAAGFVEHIVKPVDFAQLKKTIHAVVSATPA